ncbi:MAG: TfoX/Sxy family protein [bacterium]|nr:TfoX/Sxy family protein [bacterium]
MAYNEEVAARIRKLFDGQLGISERKMFGGLVFMDRGNMCCGASYHDMVMIRVGKEKAEEVLKMPHTEPFRLKGFIFIRPEGFATDESLKKFVDMAREYTAKLPDK